MSVELIQRVDAQSRGVQGRVVCGADATGKHSQQILAFPVHALSHLLQQKPWENNEMHTHPLPTRLWIAGAYKTFAGLVCWSYLGIKYLGSLEQVVSPGRRGSGSADQRNFHVGIVGGVVQANPGGVGPVLPRRRLDVAPVKQEVHVRAPRERLHKVVVVLRQAPGHRQLGRLLVGEDGLDGEVAGGDGRVAGGVAPTHVHHRPLPAEPDHQPHSGHQRVIGGDVLRVHRPLCGEAHCLDGRQAALLAGALVDAAAGDQLQRLRIHQKKLVVVAGPPGLGTVGLGHWGEAILAVAHGAGLLLKLQPESVRSVQLEEVVPGPNVHRPQRGVRVEHQVLEFSVIAGEVRVGATAGDGEDNEE